MSSCINQERRLGQHLAASPLYLHYVAQARPKLATLRQLPGAGITGMGCHIEAEHSHSGIFADLEDATKGAVSSLVSSGAEDTCDRQNWASYRHLVDQDGDPSKRCMTPVVIPTAENGPA